MASILEPVWQTIGGICNREEVYSTSVFHTGERAWDEARKGKNQIMTVHLCHSKKLKDPSWSWWALLGEQL